MLQMKPATCKSSGHALVWAAERCGCCSGAEAQCQHWQLPAATAAAAQHGIIIQTTRQHLPTWNASMAYPSRLLQAVARGGASK